MPLYMDTHKGLGELTEEAVAGAHAMDLKAQDKHGAKFLNYWYNREAGTIYCLSEAPNAEAAIAVHRDGHGLLADEIVEVSEGH
jgi:hypothetical protein